MKRLLLLACLLLAAHADARAQLTAIKAGRLVDPGAGSARANQIILVEGSKIKAVGGAELAIPAGATVIDLSKSTVLPGLFDCHTHMCFMVDQRGPERGSLYFHDLVYTTGYRALEGAANARQMLESGFTTIRDVGNAGNYADTDLRRAIERGLVPGPTIVNAGRIIAPFGGQYFLQPERRELGAPEYFAADTRDEMRKAIRENIHFGAKVIKIVVDDQRYIYSAEDIRFIVEEARAAGVKVAAHCLTEAGARNAAEAGVASIEHGLIMSDEALALAKRNGVVLVGTDFTEKAWLAYAMPEKQAKQLHATMVDRLRRAYTMGVTLAYGTDLVFTVPDETRGTWSMSIVESWTEAGVPANAILAAMTVNAARLLGVEAERGEIKPGLAADIIATPGNPLEDIQALKRVSFVMKDGKVVKDAR